MLCLYLVNEHPFFMRMAANSIFMLRQHNKTIPVRLYYIEDARKETAPGAFPTVYSTDSFFDLCRTHDVEVVRRPVRTLPGDEGFFFAQRCQWEEVPEQDVLCIDGDTFISGDVAELFKKYNSDLNACPNNWVYAAGFKDELPFTPFNNGVVLWRNGWLQRWSRELPHLCRGLRERTLHPALSTFLYNFHEGCAHREEFSTSLLVERHGLSHSYFDPKDVLLLGTDMDFLKIPDSIIAHTYSQNWRRALALLKKYDRRLYIKGLEVTRPGVQGDPGRENPERGG